MEHDATSKSICHFRVTLTSQSQASRSTLASCHGRPCLLLRASGACGPAATVWMHNQELDLGLLQGVVVLEKHRVLSTGLTMNQFAVIKPRSR